MNKNIAIYNMRLAGHLMTKGFVLFDVRISDKEQGKEKPRNVFIFKQTEELLNEIERYTGKRIKKKKE